MQNTLKFLAAATVLVLMGLVTYHGTVYQIEHPEVMMMASEGW